MQLYIWRHFQILVPDGWEMLFYGKDAQAGRCTFADHYQHRLEFNWSVVPGKPDFERMINDYIAELSRADGVSDIDAACIGEWHGFVARLDEVLTSRFGRFFSDERVLVECVFLWPQSREIGNERKVLESVKYAPCTAEGYWRWCAFGMDFLVSDGLSLQECTMQPGKSQMTFRHPKNKLHFERFERLGMVSHWLRRPLPEWLNMRQPGAITVRQETQETDAGQQVVRLAGDQLVLGLKRFLGTRIRYDSRAWIDALDGRLYCQTISGGKQEITRRLAAWKESR